MDNQQGPRKSRAAQARDGVSILSVLDALRPRIESILAATGKSWEEGRGSERKHIIRCFYPDHPKDLKPSLEFNLKTNKWGCWVCKVNKERMGSTIDLVQAVARSEVMLGNTDHADQVEYPAAVKYVLGIGGPPPELKPRPPVELAKSACHRVVSALVVHEAELRTKHGHPPVGVQRWLASRGLPPVDLYGRVVHFGGYHGYKFLRLEGFSDEELELAGFRVEEHDLFETCGALIVFRDVSGDVAGVQGIRLPTLGDVAAKLTTKAEAEAAELGPHPLQVTPNDTAENLAERRDLARRLEDERKNRPRGKNYRSMGGFSIDWPFGSERAAAGPQGQGNGVLAFCEGVPDALAAEASGEAEVALGFPGASTVNSMTSENLRALVCHDDGTPRWNTLVIAMDTDGAGQAQVDVLVGKLREAGVPVFDRSDLLAACADGVTLLPADMAGKVRVFRRTTFGIDVNDSVRL